MTDPLGQSQVIPYLVGLSKKGHQITLLSCEKVENYKNHKEKISQLLSSNNIDWQPIKFRTSPKFVSSFINLSVLKKTTLKLCKERSIQLIHARSYISAKAALEAKRKLGVKFIFDMRGFWADERIDGNLWDKSNFIHRTLYNLFKKLEIDYFENADAIISLTETGKQEIKSWKNLKSDIAEISIIPCCADLDLFSYKNLDQVKVNELRNEIGIKADEFTISYLGSIGTWYMFDEMLLFYKELLKKKPNAQFLFISGTDEAIILLRAKELQVKTDGIYVRSGQREEVPLLLSLSNISLFFIKPLYSKKGSSATKLAEILGMGIPAISNTNVGDQERLFEKYTMGELVDSFDSETYKKIIDKIDDLEKLDKEELRKSAVDYYNLESGVEKYAAIYNRLKK